MSHSRPLSTKSIYFSFILFFYFAVSSFLFSKRKKGNNEETEGEKFPVLFFSLYFLRRECTFISGGVVVKKREGIQGKHFLLQNMYKATLKNCFDFVVFFWSILCKCAQYFHV